MLTYEQALEKVLKHSRPMRPVSLGLLEALGRVAAKEVISPEAFPGFDNSAVDGYAVCLPRTQQRAQGIGFKLLAEVPAGQRFRKTLEAGQAVRIFTGALIPRGTDAVVMQEHAESRNGTVRVIRTPMSRENIRFRGEDFLRGKVLLRKGTLLEPTHLAVLRAVGREKILVYPSPRVTLLATGSELLKEGERSSAGKVRDCNTLLLQSLVKELGALPHALPCVDDDPRKIRAAVERGLETDVLLISGGVSVGRYDFVRSVLKEEGIREIFWKVDIKPGKPLFFGKKGRTLVFGLPGNPVSVFVTFEQFVKPAILKMQGRTNLNGEWLSGRLTEPVRNSKRLHFMRVRCVVGTSGYRITPIKGQGSHMIGSLADANAILPVGPGGVLKRNQTVSVKILNKG